MEIDIESRRLPRDGLECQNKRASSKVLGSLLSVGTLGMSDTLSRAQLCEGQEWGTGIQELP